MGQHQLQQKRGGPGETSKFIEFGDSKPGKWAAFCSGGRLEVTDMALGSIRLLENIIDWEVPSQLFLSDHRHILFTVQGSIPERLVRNHRGTNWSSFKGDLRNRLERGPEIDMRNEAGLGLEIYWVQQTLI
jgi:hypothetical protein